MEKYVQVQKINLSSTEDANMYKTNVDHALNFHITTLSYDKMSLSTNLFLIFYGILKYLELHVTYVLRKKSFKIFTMHLYYAFKFQ